jgi:hypothetical protein
MAGPILLLKTITTLRPSFFEHGERLAHTYVDPLLGHTATSVDLGQLYWCAQLNETSLANLVALETPVADGLAQIDHALDVRAVDELGQAKAILRLFSQRMPSAAELLFCFRVISRCVAIASRHQEGFDVHLTRGLICTEYDQYRLSDILKAAAEPHGTALGRCLLGLLKCLHLPDDTAAAVITLRNDGELNQAILLASIVRRTCPAATIILDTSGANEQFNFNEWVPLLRASASTIRSYIDYFLPRQDYKATLRAVLQAVVLGGRHPVVTDTDNAVCFVDELGGLTRPVVAVRPIAEAFGDYIKSLPVFYTAGQRTIVGRLSPAKCHWAACEFCTINSQHLMPRGAAMFDATYRRDFDRLARKITDDHIESLILMDEALHPDVLITFARELLSRHISILYRARCRFTNALTADACQLLYESGCRYLGLGLESASPRVNSLVNKHLGPPVNYDRPRPARKYRQLEISYLPIFDDIVT